MSVQKILNMQKDAYYDGARDAIESVLVAMRMLEQNTSITPMFVVGLLEETVKILERNRISS